MYQHKLVTKQPILLHFASYRGSGLSIIEKLPGGMECVEVLNFTQLLMFTSDVHNAPVRRSEAYGKLAALQTSILHREERRADPYEGTVNVNSIFVVILHNTAPLSVCLKCGDCCKLQVWILSKKKPEHFLVTWKFTKQKQL